MPAPIRVDTGQSRPLPLIACLAALLTGCASAGYVMTDRGPQAYYQTGYPVQDTSREIERILRSVKRIQVTGSYTTYRFAEEDSITEGDVRQQATYRRAIESYSFHHSKAGTAVITARTTGALRLLTSEHATRLPDTIIVHYEEPRGTRTSRQAPRHVESVSIKVAQLNVVLDLPDVLQFRVVSSDRTRDIALIGVDLTGIENVLSAHPLRVRYGDPSQLVWGSFVYVLGYPRGFKMVTRGIVSDPGSRPDNAFLVDGLFNPGISGGMILAVRGETGELEWVGMARAASSQRETLLLPELREGAEDGMLLPYDGRLYMEQVSRIDYGITFSVPMTQIERFLRSTAEARPPR
jgi:S1-C subfamily serine protease